MTTACVSLLNYASVHVRARGHLFRIVDTLLREYGDSLSLRFGRQRIYLDRDPATVEEVLATKKAAFRKHKFSRDLQGLLGEGLITSDGDLWRFRRRLIQPIFYRQALRQMVSSLLGSQCPVDSVLAAETCCAVVFDYG